jgi:hypothetical protein
LIVEAFFDLPALEFISFLAVCEMQSFLYEATYCTRYCNTQWRILFFQKTERALRQAQRTKTVNNKWIFRSLCGGFCTFPLRGNALVDGPPLSTKFLHLFCEELAKAKFDQTSRSKSYFPPREPVPPTVGSMVP